VSQGAMPIKIGDNKNQNYKTETERIEAKTNSTYVVQSG